MSRFVILHHQFPESHSRSNHWDLMLEMRGRLLTWSLESLPQINQVLMVDQLADHRIAYLDYEGPVSGDRGWVERWDTGQLTWLADVDEPRESAKPSPTRYFAHLVGQQIQGQLELVRVTADEVALDSPPGTATHQRWRLCISKESATRD